MNYDKIQAALETRAATVTGIPHIVYDNVKYDPTTRVPYVQSRFIPTNRTNKVLGIGADNKPHWQEYHGIYQLLINMPEGTGSKQTNDLVNNIVDAFDTTTDLEFAGVYVTIKKAERAKGVSEAPWYKTPVNIYWYSQTK